jgi:hypothetical protein
MWADKLLVVAIRLAVQLVNHARNWSNVSSYHCEQAKDNSQAIVSLRLQDGARSAVRGM